MKKTIFSKILAFLNISKEEVKVDAEGNPIFSAEQTEKLKGFFGETYEKVLLAVNNELAAENNSNTELEAVRTELAEGNDPENGNDPEGGSDPENRTDPDLVAQIQEMKRIQGEQKKKIETLEKDPEVVNPEKIDPEGANIAFDNTVSSTSHLFGIDHAFFSREKWYNESAATRKVSELRNKAEEKKNEELLMNDFGDYAASISARFHQLQQEGKLSVINDPKSSSINYTDLETQWGAAHYVRRQDALIAYLMDIPTVTGIFPVRYGVQDKEEMTNAFFGDFSQVYQNSEHADIYKGSYKLQPEIAQVYRAMFKHKFSDLKELEKEHIGYLNREGSDPIKWTFIEWLISQTGRKLIVEQDQRRVIGRGVALVTDTPGHYLHAADGVLAKIQKYIDAFQILPFADKNTYTKSTILAYVEALVELVNQILPGSLEGWKLYINAKHIPWYKADFRSSYGTDADFGGAELKAIDYSLDMFVPVPNMDPVDYRMWITVPNNIELLAPKAGEMLGMYFERRFENLYAMSWWGEGVAAYRSGQNFATAAALATNNYKNQFIFTNVPETALVDGATTCDGSVNSFFKTIQNTGATVITDITSAKQGRVYRITCGHTTNATTITKENKFSTIASTWTPTAVGDYIEVYHRSSDDKFLEVARRVTA